MFHGIIRVLMKKIATGWCNNVAWNVGPFNEYQYIQDGVFITVVSLDRRKNGTFDFSQNLIRTPSGDFKQVSEEV